MEDSSFLTNSSDLTDIPKNKHYSIEKPDKVSKKIALNIFRRKTTNSFNNKLKLFTFLENFYKASVKIVFLSIQIHSILVKTLEKKQKVFLKLQKSLLQRNFSILINFHNKQSELLEKSEKLEKILRSRSIKKLESAKTDHLSEFALNILKRVLSSFTYRRLFSTFTQVKTHSRSQSFSRPQNFKKFLCFSVRGIMQKYLQKLIRDIFEYSNKRKSQQKTLSKLFSVFLMSSAKVWEVLKYYEKTPKYFLSFHWKYNKLNLSQSTSRKKSAIFSLSSLLSKKFSCLQCFALCKISQFQYFPFSSSISPVKCNVSESTMSTSIKQVKSKYFPIFSNEEETSYLKFLFLRLFDVLQTRVNQTTRASFIKIKTCPKSKGVPRRSCKDLPICRKLNSSSSKTFSIQETTYSSLSPIGRKSNSRK
jgi:hypothetical protein